VVETRQLIKGLGKEHTILLSTHILPEVSMVCQQVIVINDGRIVAVDKPENLSARLRGSEQVRIEVRGPSREVLAKLRAVKGVREVAWQPGAGERNGYNVEVQPGLDLREELSRLVVNSGWGLLGLQAGGLSLEEIFLKLTTKEEL